MKKVKVRSLASGDNLSISYFDFPGTKKGAPTAYLQAAMHGSEVQGSLVLLKLREYLKKNPPLGDIRFVPFANPVGLNEKQGEYNQGRFDTSTGINWNRAYFLPNKEIDWASLLAHRDDVPKLKSLYRAQLRKNLLGRSKESLAYAESLAIQLQLLSIDYDHVLDLHCANQSVRHIYVPSFAKEDARFFTNSPFQILMTNEFGGAFDEVSFVPWWILAERCNQEPLVQAFTIELGNQETISTKDAAADLESILNYLRHRGVIRGKAKATRPTQCEQEKYYCQYAPIGGLAEFVAPLGKKLAKGALVANIYHPASEVACTPIHMPFAGIPILYHSSAIVHEGAELVKFFKTGPYGC